MNYEAEHVRFIGLSNTAHVAVAEACGPTRTLREVYRAWIHRGNPKHAAVLTRKLLGEVAAAQDQMRIFEAHALGLLADIDASIPAEETTLQPS